MTGPDRKGERKQSRRDFLLRAGATATGLVFAPTPLAGRLGAAGARQAATRIGIIGSGNIGGAVGLKWAEAGHEILFSSRHPEELTELVERAGPKRAPAFRQRPPLLVRLFSSPYPTRRSPR